MWSARHRGKAAVLGRRDLAGKTGTTNDQFDAWFAGFQRNPVAVVWMGDQPKSLGGAETNGQAALPIWINYMGKVLKNAPEYQANVPEGVVVQSTILATASPMNTIIRNIPTPTLRLHLDNGARDQPMVGCRTK